MKFYYCIKNSHNFKQIYTQNPYNNFKWKKIPHENETFPQCIEKLNAFTILLH